MTSEVVDATSQPVPTPTTPNPLDARDGQPKPPTKRSRKKRRSLRWASYAALVLLAAGVGGYFWLNAYLRNIIASQSTKSLNLTCDLDSAVLSPLGGKVRLHGFRIHSPPGFSTEPLLDVQSGDLVMSYRELGKQPCRVDLITMDRPRLLVEIVGGRLNTKAMTDNIPPGDPNTERLRLNIGRIDINNPVVVLRPGFKNLPTEIVIPVESFSIENVGAADGSQNGAPVKDVTKQLVRALITKAKKSPAMPSDIRGVLEGDLSAIAATFLPGKTGETLGAILAPKLGGSTTKVFSIFGGKPDTRPSPATTRASE